MVGNDSLYIIGGIDGSGVTQKDVHILNVTSMTWLNGSATNTYDQTIDAASSSASSSSSSLSGGAIAGIVIGTVAAVSFEATRFFFSAFSSPFYTRWPS
jgi:hypothetical protein